MPATPGGGRAMTMHAQWNILLKVRQRMEQGAQQAWRRCCDERDEAERAVARIEEARRALAAQGTATLDGLGQALAAAARGGAAVDRTSQASAVPYLARLRRQDQQLTLQWLQAQLRLAAEQRKVDQALQHRRQAESARMRTEEALETFARADARRAARRAEDGIEEFLIARHHPPSAAIDDMRRP
ncbi:hypothetical protein [Pseudoduganella lutea]|uniref:Flagellar FliJ protein n=1 Tax=Pseudoduganella lutea TaxID=321985 RepID=A0A4P6KS66_9BURK|nr:hypothetical protein [Pseudoduganella lutea]QBE61949.1 hypothetical protein EWM63_02205 [Pseudoduganella lutea]